MVPTYCLFLECISVCLYPGCGVLTFLSPLPVYSNLSRWAHLLLKITEVNSAWRRLKLTTHLSIRTGFLEHSESKKSSGSVKLVLSGSERRAASSCCLVCKTLTTLRLYKACTQIFHFYSPIDVFGSPASVFMCCEPVIMPDHHTSVWASPLLLAEQCCAVFHGRFVPPQDMTHSDGRFIKGGWRSWLSWGLDTWLPLERLEQGHELSPEPIHVKFVT